MIHYITKVQMVFGEEQFDNSKKRPYYGRHNVCTLYHKGVDGIRRRTVRQFEKDVVLREAYCGVDKGHYAVETTTKKISNNGLWPTIMKDVIQYCRQCDLCQRIG